MKKERTKEESRRTEAEKPTLLETNTEKSRGRKEGSSARKGAGMEAERVILSPHTPRKNSSICFAPGVEKRRCVRYRERRKSAQQHVPSTIKNNRPTDIETEDPCVPFMIVVTKNGNTAKVRDVQRRRGSNGVYTRV